MPDHAWAKFQPSGGLGGGLSVTKRGQRRGRSSGRPRAIEIRDPFGRKEGRMVMPATRTLFSLIHQRTVGAKLHYYVPLHEPLSSSPLLQFSFPDVDENFTRG